MFRSSMNWTFCLFLRIRGSSKIGKVKDWGWRAEAQMAYGYSPRVVPQYQLLCSNNFGLRFWAKTFSRTFVFSVLAFVFFLKINFELHFFHKKFQNFQIQNKKNSFLRPFQIPINKLIHSTMEYSL